MKIAKWFVLLVALSAGAGAQAQQPSQSQPQSQAQAPSSQEQTSDTPSAADAARRARDEKKTQTKANRVYDNDSMPRTDTNLPEGNAEAAPENAPAETNMEKPADQGGAQTAGAEGQKSATGQPDAQKGGDEQAAHDAALAKSKEHLKELETQLDVLSRQYALDAQQFYSRPDFANDKAGEAKLQSEEADIDAKKQEVAEAQKEVDEAQSKAGPPPEVKKTQE
jgi:hypothetical protein